MTIETIPTTTTKNEAPDSSTASEDFSQTTKTNNLNDLEEIFGEHGEGKADDKPASNAGRPRKSDAHKRKVNRERQKRHRNKQTAKKLLNDPDVINALANDGVEIPPAVSGDYKPFTAFPRPLCMAIAKFPFALMAERLRRPQAVLTDEEAGILAEQIDRVAYEYMPMLDSKIGAVGVLSITVIQLVVVKCMLDPKPEKAETENEDSEPKPPSKPKNPGEMFAGLKPKERL